jgi:hypothetical protein
MGRRDGLVSIESRVQPEQSGVWIPVGARDYLFARNTQPLDDWLTVLHRSITLFDLQLYAQILIYLRIIHLLKFSTCFEHYPAHPQEVYVLIVYICSLWYRHCLQVTVQCTGWERREERTVFLNRCTRHSPAESDDTRGCIYIYIYIQLWCRPPEDEQGNARNM